MALDLAQLREPFAPGDIEWRVGRGGKTNDKVWAQVLAYVTNRAIMERLDTVCSPENWANMFKEWHGAAQLCGISIQVAPDQWVTKWDGAPGTHVEEIKGGLSDAMKRAAVQWGIGRYLYRLGVSYANIVEKGNHRDRIKCRDGEEYIQWNDPTLPAWALPGGKANGSPPADGAPGPPPEKSRGGVRHPTANQIKRLYAIAHFHGWADDAIHAYALKEWEVEHLDQLSLEQYKLLCGEKEEKITGILEDAPPKQESSDQLRYDLKARSIIGAATDWQAFQEAVTKILQGYLDKQLDNSAVLDEAADKMLNLAGNAMIDGGDLAALGKLVEDWAHFSADQRKQLRVTHASMIAVKEEETSGEN
jgi:hypothetical protein